MAFDGMCFECGACMRFGPPSEDSAHKCAYCHTPVHIFGCSTERPEGGEEGSGGTDRLCLPCSVKGSNKRKDSSQPPVQKKKQKFAAEEVNDSESPIEIGSELFPWHTILPFPPDCSNCSFNCKGITITSFDLNSLKEKSEITDGVIYALGQILVEEADDSWAEIFTLPCHALQNITFGVDSYLTETAKSPIIFNDIWIVPSSVNAMHWVFFLVLIRKKKIVVLDFLYTKRALSKVVKEHLQILRYIINSSHEYCLQSSVDWTQWKIFCPTDFPRQKSTNDCGIYVCIWMFSVLSGVMVPEECFEPGDLVKVRKWISHTIIRNSNKNPVRSSSPQDKPEMADNFYAAAKKAIEDGIHVIEKPWSVIPDAQIHFSKVPGGPTSGTLAGGATSGALSYEDLVAAVRAVASDTDPERLRYAALLSLWQLDDDPVADDGHSRLSVLAEESHSVGSAGGRTPRAQQQRGLRLLRPGAGRHQAAAQLAARQVGRERLRERLDAQRLRVSSRLHPVGGRAAPDGRKSQRVQHVLRGGGRRLRGRRCPRLHAVRTS